MSTKRYLYAAVGAPVVAAKTARERMETVRGRLATRREESWNEASKQIDEWAREGEKLVERLTDSKTLDEFAAKVDFDQVQEQVSRLRDQLEDLLETWRANFRPAGEHKPAAAVEAQKEIEKKAAEQRAATAAAKTPTAKRPAPSKTTAKPAPKKPAARKPAPKKPATGAGTTAPGKPETKAS